MALPYLLEKQVAIAAVTRACHLTSSIFASNASKMLVSASGSPINRPSSPTLTQTKADYSPVTVADYSAQAVINTILGSAFPDDPIVGEEDADDLRKDESKELRDRISGLVREAFGRDEGIDAEEVGLGFDRKKTRSVEELLDAIDKGRYAGGPKGRMWCLDPIDGTKGYLRGGQYAVCLALIVDSQVQVGVIGCPNLPFGEEATSGKVTPGAGSLFVAVRGQGAEQRLYPAQPNTKPIKLSIPTFSPSEGLPPLRLLESVEAAHSSHSFGSVVTSELQITTPSLRMDSQAKYCSLAAQSTGGGGDIYLRFPVPGKNYVEKIWDHAAGNLIVEESGGVVSDSQGKPLNFGLGRTLGENFGIVACGKSVHGRVMNGIHAAQEKQNK